MIFKINGRTVSKREWDRHYANKVSVYGDPFQDMLESRHAPMMKDSDRMFISGAFAQTPTHGLDPLSADRTITRARKAGINTHGKVFMSQLGPPESPLAWVSGIEDFKTSLKLQGKGCESMGIKPIVKDPTPDIPLADDIILEEISTRMESDPGLKAKLKEKPEAMRELREEIIEKHGPRKK